jgi:predicted RNA-binding Zn-ribbon protein involved in translation (DUF1610 family)
MPDQDRPFDEVESREEDILTQPAHEDVRFPCDNCGARLRWCPDADALVCEHCGNTVAVPRVEGTIVERPLAEAGDAARGFGIARRVIRCGNCGAQVSLDEKATADFCVYCGSSRILDQSENRNAIRPETMIPLDISRPAARKVFSRWVKSLWFRPNGLRKASSIVETGLYVPFWTFDCGVSSDWSADAGYYYYVTETYWTTVNGKRVMRTRQKRKVRWVPKWGHRDDVYDDVLINGSRGLPQDLVAQLGEFDLRELVPYQSAYLAGWQAEEYQVDLDTSWSMAHEFVVMSQRSRCSGDVPGDTQRNLRVKNDVFDIRWKHILLPIWVLQYKYNARVYTVLIHGQSGKIVGKAPYSWVKISLLVLGILAAIGITAAAILGLGSFR